jgi:hypothetical protein
MDEDRVQSDIIEFSDEKQPDARNLFQEWRKKHPDGFVLAIKKPKSLLHCADCDHLDDSEESVEWSLTKKPKICSLNRLALKKWAAERAIDNSDCDCL